MLITYRISVTISADDPRATDEVGEYVRESYGSAEITVARSATTCPTTVLVDPIGWWSCEEVYSAAVDDCEPIRTRIGEWIDEPRSIER
jgi:hypothetical protein